MGSPKRPDHVPPDGTSPGAPGVAAVSGGDDESGSGMILAMGWVIASAMHVDDHVRQRAGTVAIALPALSKAAPQRQRMPTSGMMLAYRIRYAWNYKTNDGTACVA